MENGINMLLSLFSLSGGGVVLFDSSFYLDTIPVELDPLSSLGYCLFFV